MEPLASSILLNVELYMTHTAQPIHIDTTVPSHAMPDTDTAAAYTQSSYQLATSVTLLRHVTYNHDRGAFPELQCVQHSYEPLAIQKQCIWGVHRTNHLDQSSLDITNDLTRTTLVSCGMYFLILLMFLR